MSELKTTLNRSDGVISSQNKILNHYAVQLQSAVVSTDHKKAILREMQLELTAQHYRRPEHRSVAYEVTHSSSVKLEMSSQPSLIQTGGQVSAPSVTKAVDNSYIKTQRSTEYIRTSRLTYSDSVKEAFKITPNAVGVTPYGFNNQKYITGETDSEGSEAIEMLKTVQSTGGVVAQTGGMLRTAVKSTSNGIGSIKTMVKNGVKLGSRKDIAKIATSVRGSVANVAKDTGHQLLKTQIDKSKITDTGTETIKQGFTELRYVDNARKAVLNTARTTVKAGYAIKNMPKDTRVHVRNIKKNVKRTVETANQTAWVIKKILTSKASLIILLAILLILLIVTLLNGLVTVIVTAVTSLFSWLVSEDENKDASEILADYSTSIIEYVDNKQDEIDKFVDGFICDRRQYPPYDEIAELNQYGNKKITLENKNPVLAILAVLRYRELDEDKQEEFEFEFTDEEIQEVTDKFFTFDYWYTYGHCSAPYCKKQTTVTIYNQGTPYEFAVETTEYYCDVSHQWLYGEVKNHTAEKVMEEYAFTDEEKDLYSMYLAQITELTEED